MNKRTTSRERNLELYRLLHQRITFVDQQDRWRCFYCGQEGGTIDHQPPLSVMSSLLTSSMSFECVIVPSCHNCNGLLGAARTITLSERMNLLKDRLRSKYRKELRLQGQWTMDEILELGPALRAMVLGSVHMGFDAEERLLYPGHRIAEDAHVECGFMRACDSCGCLITDDEMASCPVCKAPV